MKAIWCPARHASNNDDCRNQFCNTCFLFRTCAPNFYLHGKASTVDASWMFQGGPDFGGALQYCLPLWDVRLPYSVFKHPFALFAGLQCIVTVCQVMSSAFATKSLTISHWQDSIFSAPPGRRPPAAQRRHHILYHICIWTWMSKIAGTQFCFVHSVQCHKSKQNQKAQRSVREIAWNRYTVYGIYTAKELQMTVIDGHGHSAASFSISCKMALNRRSRGTQKRRLCWIYIYMYYVICEGCSKFFLLQTA